MHRFLLFFLCVVLTTLLSAQPANTFFSTFDAERGNALAPARDGNLWLGGMKDERVLLTKLSLSGKVIEKHGIDFQGNGLDTENLVEFFEDPDGTLVGCGNFENDNSGRAFVFRYNPTTRTVLWAHIVRSGGLNGLFGMAPLGPGGGDYVLYGNPQFAGGNDAELLRLDRLTGQIVPGKAKRFGIGRADHISQAVYHNGALYACGRFTNSNTGFEIDFARSRNALCKIDTATLEPVWTRIGPIPTATFAQISGRDLIIDNSAIISTYSGEANDPNLFASTIFLQKNDLAGNLLWAKQYDLPEWNGEFAEEVIALPDGYMLYGHDLLSDFSRLFLLKTDKQGNPVAAVKIDYDENEEFAEIPARSKILRMGDALFFTALSQNNLGQTQGILARTDLNGWVSDSCGFFQKTAVQLVTMPAPVSEVVVPTVTASLATLTPALTETDSPGLVFYKKCGATGSCPTLSDIRLTLDSMPCRNGVPLLYYTICNVGGQPYVGGAWIQIFDKNPLTDTARVITAALVSHPPILPGDCLEGSYFSSELRPPAPFELDTFPVLYGLIGANLAVQTPIQLSGFPYAPNAPECSYLNNLDSLVVPPQVCGNCAAPSTFVKKIGNPTERELAFSMCSSSTSKVTGDGSVYIAGRQGDDPMIAKITALGEPIWVRNFAGNANFPTELTEIIQDSDRMLVLCGTQGNSPSNRHAVAMRYDPVADQVLWAQQYPANRPVASGILEKSEGGNFLLSSNSQEFVGGMLKTRSELLELDRTTGAVVPTLAVRYLGEPNLRIEDMAMSDGDLYAAGSWQTGAQQPLLPMFAKISTTDGQPQWAFLTDPDSTATGQKVITPGAMVLDDDIVFIAGSEDVAPNDPANNNFLYLEKRRTDGSLTWMRRYDISMFPQDVIRVENAVIVFGTLSNNRWGMVRVDITTGDLIAAKTLDIAPPSNNFTLFPNRKNQLIRAGIDLLMLDHTDDGMGGGDLLLLRTDTNFGLDDTCSLLRQTPVSVVTRPAKSRPLTFQAVPTLTTAATWSQIFRADSLNVSKLCPRCDCEGVPDVTFKLTRIGCAADSSLEYRAEVCNLGLGALSGPFEVTFFDKNPLTQAAQAVWSITVNAPLAPGQCKEMTWPLPAAASQYSKLYTLVGVGSGAVTPVDLAGFPYSQSGVEECRYTNNLDSFVVKTPVCDGCENPATFVKTMGRADQSEFGYSLCTASDGNVYMAGKQGQNPMVAKMTPNGEMLWVRNFPTGTGFLDDVDLVEILEDSEGKIVVCGTRNHSPNTRRAVAMRYDPVADQVLWFKEYGELNPEVLGIFEKTAGGNFVVYGFSDEQFGGGGAGTYYRSRSHLWELNRATGEVVPALATLFPGNPSTSVYFQDMVPHEGSLYCVGGWYDHDISGSGRAMLTKLSATDGIPEWVQGTLLDTIEEFQFFNWRRVLVDNDQLVVLGSGLTDVNLPTQKTFVFLAKYDLNGTLLWMKSYQSELGATDMVALPDGYAIFGRTKDNAWGVLKTDKDGNLLTAKKLNVPTTGQSFQFFCQNQLLRLPNHLMMVTDFKSGTFNDLLLLKTNYNFNLDAPCDLFQPLQVKVATRAPTTNLLGLAFQPYAVTAVNQEAAFQSDSLNIKRLCPTCPCLDKPDITLTVDSIYCTLSDGIVANLSICNLGQVASTDDFNLTFYHKNPLEGVAVPLYSLSVSEQPSFGDCVKIVLPLDTALLKYPKIYSLIGVWKDVQTPISLDDFPFANGFAECDYKNNLYSFEMNIATPVPLDLGPDRSICQGQTATLDAGSGYAAYQWLNGPATQTFAVSTAGTYIAEVTDACGRKQRDTVQVTVLPYPTSSQTVVLLPGGSVTIGGTAYTGPAVVQDTVPSLTGGCDTLVTYTLLLDSLGCAKPSAFLKTYDQPGKLNQGGILLAAADGTFYIGGDSETQPFLMKTDSNGTVLWSRNFEFIPGGGNQELTALIEDSDGMLVGCGSRGGSNTSKEIYAFRYNPATNLLLWVKQTSSTTNVKAYGILEETPGGNYLLYANFIPTPAISNAELWRLDRATGNLTVGTTNRYSLAGASYFKSMAIRNGALYGVGEFTTTSTGTGKKRQGLAKIDLATGSPVWATVSHVDTTLFAELDGHDLLVEQDTVVSLFYGKENAGSGEPPIFLQKTGPSGEVLWVQRYEGFSASGGKPIALVAVASGYIFSANAGNNLVVVKTKRNGELVWARVLVGASSYNLPDRGSQALAVRGDDLYFISSTFKSLGAPTQVLFGKMNKDGDINDDCAGVIKTTLNASKVASPYSRNIPVLRSTPVRSLQVPSVPTAGAPFSFLPKTLCINCLPPCVPVAVTKTIAFYPGDTITIDGVAYTQSDTVVQNFITPAGCDSVVTNLLQLVITEVKITCPNNLTVTLPPNLTATVVDYSLPTVTTNCPDSTIALTLLQGLPVGGNFPQGTTQVCYEAANQCGIRDTCCFTITAELPDSPCDVKSPVGCIRYDLLSIRLDSIGQRRYRVRMTNTCPSPLEFAYIQLPNGVLAVSPANNATYSAPGGNAYAVRNPNASPFYSVRYKAVVKNLNNGESDIFEYTLPQQAQPAYIHAAARLTDGTYSEAHLNTYNCPEVIENLELRIERASRSQFSILNSQLPRAQFSIFNFQLLVRPNPTDGTLFVQVPDWRFDSKSNLQSQVHLQVLNAQGQTLLSQQVWVENGQFKLELPTGLASGLYYLVAQPEGGERVAVRFVLER